MFELKLPEIGENVEEAVVSRLLVSEGDVIKAEQTVMELDSEKASFPLPCPRAGRVAKIAVKEYEEGTSPQQRNALKGEIAGPAVRTKL